MKDYTRVRDLMVGDRFKVAARGPLWTVMEHRPGGHKRCVDANGREGHPHPPAVIDHIEGNVYAEHGYADRDTYLCFMADAHGHDADAVLQLAMMLGAEEDFDGLINILEDGEYFNE